MPACHCCRRACLARCFATAADPLSAPSRSSPQDARGEDGIFKGADALVIDTGANNEDEIYSKSKALQTWLVGYELTETIILICSRSVHVLTGKKKGACAQSATRASPESV
jgi:nucleosome binding factor SPN SPT16 subunit